jgi:DNA repair exonuclease SbcCD ATPase subunit
MLPSKALKMQQDTEDMKNEVIIKSLEDKIKKLESFLKEKDILLQTAVGSLAELRSQNSKLSKELSEARMILDESSWRFDQETKDLKTRVKAKAEKNTRLHESIKDLRNKCVDFATRCVDQLKGIFNSVGAASEKFTPLVEDIPRAFNHIESEVEALDEVISGYGDFCALVASRGTTATVGNLFSNASN